MTNIEKEIRFQEIYTQYEKLVWWHLHNKLIASKEERENVSQEIWLAMWSNIERIEDGKEHAFLYKVMTNHIKKWLYYHKRDQHYDLDAEQEESSEEQLYTPDQMFYKVLDETEDPYQYLEVVDFINSILTDEETQMFMYRYNGLSNREIAKAMNLSHTTIYSKLVKIRNKLKNALIEANIFTPEDIEKNSYTLSEEHKAKLRKKKKITKIREVGWHWYNNGIENVQGYECPEGFVEGRLMKPKKE